MTTERGRLYYTAKAGDTAAQIRSALAQYKARTGHAATVVQVNTNALGAGELAQSGVDGVKVEVSRGMQANHVLAGEWAVLEFPG